MKTKATGRPRKRQLVQRLLFDPGPPGKRQDPRQRPGWAKVRTSWPGKWRLIGTDYSIEHCGHPTAIHPYHGTDPEGRTIVDANRTGFNRLVEAQAAIEQLARKRAATRS
jgi:hypothetical protein